MGTIGCREISVRNYYYSLRKKNKKTDTQYMPLKAVTQTWSTLKFVR